MSAVPEILEQPHPSEGNHRPGPASPRRRGVRAVGGAIAGGVLAATLLTGIVPRVAQRHRLAAGATAAGVSLPSVTVTTVTHDTSPSSVSLPGALTAVQTAAIYARTPGYVRRRLVDIGSRVRAGQLLADIDAPDLDQQVTQARTAGGVSGTSPAGSGSAPGSLFTIAQTDTLSVYVTVPEGYAAAVAIGQPAVVTLPVLPGDTLRGRVARTAGSLDATARTLLAEVRVANPKSAFLPGMYAQVQLALGAGTPPLRVPATALVIRDGPPQVVMVAPDSTVRYQTVTIGRDLGSWVEVTGGLEQGVRIVINPPSDLQDGARVRVAGAR